MRWPRRSLHAVALVALILPLTGIETQDPPPPVARFAPIDVFVDSGAAPLAAYQLAIRATAGDIRIAGIEGGAHAAFAEPPYYDPAAMQDERVVIAAFSTAAADDLPTGRTRIATIHVHIRGDVEPVLAGAVAVAATVDGQPIDAAFTLTRRDR